jgi:hypothetical protein
MNKQGVFGGFFPTLFYAVHIGKTVLFGSSKYKEQVL